MASNMCTCSPEPASTWPTVDASGRSRKASRPYAAASRDEGGKPVSPEAPLAATQWRTLSILCQDRGHARAYSTRVRD